MRAVAIIPARMSASRFPGKPMKKILGIPMIGHCYYRTNMCSLVETYVATCDEEIASYINSIGGECIFTSSSHNRATDRTAEALQKIEDKTGKVDIVLMVQGDEPLVNPKSLEQLITYFQDESINVVNIMSKIDDDEQFSDYNNVKVVVNKFKDALYFSREPIPSRWKKNENIPKYMQLGIIGFRKESLLWFNERPETELEQVESVDMNRFLENGIKIRMVLDESSTIGVDTPEELTFCEKLMKKDKLFDRYKKNERKRNKA